MKLTGTWWGSSETVTLENTGARLRSRQGGGQSKGGAEGWVGLEMVEVGGGWLGLGELKGFGWGRLGGRRCAGGGCRGGGVSCVMLCGRRGVQGEKGDSGKGRLG